MKYKFPLYHSYYFVLKNLLYWFLCNRSVEGNNNQEIISEEKKSFTGLLKTIHTIRIKE